MLFFILTVEIGAAQSFTWTWTRKVGFAGLNDPFCVNPQNPNTILSSAGNQLIVLSRNKGKSWTTFAVVSGGNQVKAIEVNAHDSSTILVAQEGDTIDRIVKTTNSGFSWTTTLSGNFYYFGRPFAYEPLLDDDIIYTMASNTIYRSTDFGSTWDSIGNSGAFGSANNGWEDALVRADSSNILYVADNGTGIWKSRDAGVTWRRTYAAVGEVPALAINSQNPAVAFATRWGGGGGVVRTTDFGETWQSLPAFSGLQTWGASVSSEDPNVVAFGTWGPAFPTSGGVYISRDGGSTWNRTWQGFSSSLTNHAVFIVDTMTVLSLWGDGIWKLGFPGTISGVVFNDANNNSVQDSGEAGLNGRKVMLSGTHSDSVASDVNGYYTFSPLDAGPYTITVQPPAGWSVSLPDSGSYTLIVSEGEKYANRDFGLMAPSSVTFAATEGWNMLSVPVVLTDPDPDEVFPGASSDVFAYSSSGYFAVDSLVHGRGYWLKFAQPQNIVVGGGVLAEDTLEVAQGWNLVGSITQTVSVDSIIQVPSGIVLSSFFGFAGGVYSATPAIEPMRSYWVKASQPGMLILRSP